MSRESNASGSHRPQGQSDASSTEPASAALYSELALEEGMQELLELFVADLPQMVRSMQEAQRAGDLARLSQLAHQVKGAAGGYGFEPISRAAGSLERLCREGGAGESIVEAVQELARLCRRATADRPPGSSEAP